MCWCAPRTRDSASLQNNSPRSGSQRTKRASENTPPFACRVAREGRHIVPNVRCVPPDLVPPHGGGGGTDEGGDGGGLPSTSNAYRCTPLASLAARSALPPDGGEQDGGYAPAEKQHQTVGYKPQEITRSGSQRTKRASKNTPPGAAVSERSELVGGIPDRISRPHDTHRRTNRKTQPREGA